MLVVVINGKLHEEGKEACAKVLNCTHTSIYEMSVLYLRTFAQLWMF